MTWFKRHKPDQQLSAYKDVFVLIYSNLYSTWLETGDLDQCNLQIDVGQFPESVDLLINVINNNFHFYEMTLFKIKASKSVKPSFFKNVEFLKVELLEIPEVITASIKA